MDEEILFTIKKENLETGLRGYPVGYCVTSSVDPQEGLAYCGYPIREVAFWTPQEVIYLLYYGKKGSKEQIEEFFQRLTKRAKLSNEMIDQIYRLPKNTSPMKLFSASLLLFDMIEGKKDYKEDALGLIAKMPHLAACVINHHEGWGPTADPDFSLGYMGAFTQMLNLPKKDPLLKEVLSLFNILHYDHGGGNLSAFVGKAVASGLESMGGSLSAAMCALAGPRHGSANEQTLAFVRSVHDRLGENAILQDAEDLIEEMIEKNELVYGFGHAVLRTEDPRASLLYEFIQTHFPEDSLGKTALLLREAGPKVLERKQKISNPYPNIDAVSGVYLCAGGFDYPKYFTLLFGMSRSVGIAIQIIYERFYARGGKGTPITRPKFYYADRYQMS